MSCTTHCFLQINRYNFTNLFWRNKSRTQNDIPHPWFSSQIQKIYKIHKLFIENQVKGHDSRSEDWAFLWPFFISNLYSQSLQATRDYSLMKSQRFHCDVIWSSIKQMPHNEPNLIVNFGKLENHSQIFLRIFR